MISIAAEAVNQNLELSIHWKETRGEKDWLSNAGKNDVCAFFQKLVENAEKNSRKLPKQRRHNFVMNKFATSLLIFAGPLAYRFLHSNMPIAIPSLRTVQKILFEDYTCITEGEFRFDDLKNILTLILPRRLFQ